MMTFLCVVICEGGYDAFHEKKKDFFFLICIVGGGIQGPIGTAATNGLLCQPRVIMVMEKSVE
jgi:hypothetical protein